MVLIVDAGSLAVLGTQTAVFAFLLIEVDLQERKATKEAQECANGADGVAISTSASPSQEGNDNEGNRCDDQCRHTLDPYVHMVESVTVKMLCDGSQDVIPGLVNRLEQVYDDTSIGTVGCQERYEGAHSRHQGGNEQNKKGIAQPFLLSRIRKAVLFPFAVEP
jgi:hypothetical protein